MGWLEYPQRVELRTTPYSNMLLPNLQILDLPEKAGQGQTLQPILQEQQRHRKKIQNIDTRSQCYKSFM